MTIETLNDLFLDLLKDIYYAENKILKALPKMAKHADSPKLIEAFETHYEETLGQVDRLKQVFKEIGEKPAGKKCPAIEGLTEEADELMKEVEDAATLDAGLLAGAQAVEHYEMARYGVLVEWAKLLGYKRSVKLLQETLDQEKATDKILNKLAMAKINDRALEAANQNDEQEEGDEEEEAPRRGRAGSRRRTM